MFDTLTERLSGILDRIIGRGALSEAEVEEALREVRHALLEADVAPAGAAEITRNATSIGLEDGHAALDLDMSSLAPGLVLADVIVNPPQTRLIRDAAVRGCKTIDGLCMLVNQGVISVEILDGGRRLPACNADGGGWDIWGVRGRGGFRDTETPPIKGLGNLLCGLRRSGADVMSGNSRVRRRAFA